MGALRSGLAIGEVQARLNPHVGSGERGVSPGSPRQWTVVGIAPSPHKMIILRTPTSPGSRRALPPPP